MNSYSIPPADWVCLIVVLASLTEETVRSIVLTQMRIEHNAMQNRSTETAPKRATMFGEANTPSLSEPPGA
jgi:hypothetical protein